MYEDFKGIIAKNHSEALLKIDYNLTSLAFFMHYVLFCYE